MNFTMDKPFTVTAAYAEGAELPSGCSSEIGTFKVCVWVLVRGSDKVHGSNSALRQGRHADLK